MNTQVGKVLSLLPSNYSFGKFFLEKRLVDPTAIPPQITLNYRTDYEFGTAVGFLTGKGYKLVANEKNELTLDLCGSTLKLRKKVPVFVTDFDLLDYNWKDQCFAHQGQPLAEELRAKFLERKCTLTFNPKNAGTPERRQALLRYIHSNWAIFDQQGQEITFKDVEDPALALDPARPWVVSMKKKEPELTMDGFHAELAALMTKYWSLFATKK